MDGHLHQIIDTLFLILEAKKAQVFKSQVATFSVDYPSLFSFKLSNQCSQWNKKYSDLPLKLAVDRLFASTFH